MYKASYHAAVNHLIEYGGYHRTVSGRLKIADALRDLRRVDRQWAQRERRHMLWICGSFPVKNTHPLHGSD